MKKIELLAPAGSPETLKSVCEAGADAVYVGGGLFGARAYAKNFTQEELLSAIDYVHLHGKKLHLTVNTLLKTRELEEQLYNYLLPYYKRGLDAVIVQDAGVFAFIKKHFPGMELHASTQMTITGSDGVRFWKEAGADRIVLARELSIDEIRRIHETSDIELECFVHGALCYCYSGQCLFSSMLGGRSGNRGRCAQPCRLPYKVVRDGHLLTRNAQYPLSPKDLCAIDLLPELIAAGVSSLKIEGRMKQTMYAAGVTKIYRKYLDILEAGQPEHLEAGQLGHFGTSEKETARDEAYTVTENDRRTLAELGSRSGFTAGYLRGEKGREMISLYSPKHTSGQPQDSETPEELKRPVTGSCICQLSQPICFCVTDAVSGQSVRVYGGEVQAAKNAPAICSDIEKVLRQTGDTEFQFEHLQIELDENCFIPKQFLKAVRREALEKLRDGLLQKHYRIGHASSQEDIPTIQSFSSTKALKTEALQTETQSIETPRTEQLFAVCDTLEQLAVCTKKDYIKTVALQLQGILPERLCDVITDAARRCAAADQRFSLALPGVFRADTAEVYEKQWICIEKLQKENMVDGFLAKNYDSLGFLRRMKVRPAHVWLDSQLYTFSDRAASFFREQGYENRTLPLELNAKELRRLPQDGSILVIYGHAPFMISSQCVNRNISGCDRKEKTLTLIDRYDHDLPVKNYCGVCCNVIYNALPTVLFSDRTWTEVEKIRPQTLRMDFTVEHAAQTEAVLALYEQQILGRSVTNTPFSGESTRGHFGRGVE